MTPAVEISTTATPTVLLVHGFASSAASSWVRFGWTEALSEAGFTVVATDLPGHGTAIKSEKPEDYGAIENHVLKFVDDSRDLDGVGFSLGARILLRIESDHPGTFRRLVVAGLGANAFVRRSRDSLANAIESGNPEDAEGNPLTETLMRAVDRHDDRASLVAFLRRPGRRQFSREEMERVRCPLLVVVGENDAAAVPPTRLVRSLARGKLLMIEGVDHVGTMKSPQFRDAALQFLGEGSRCDIEWQRL